MATNETPLDDSPSPAPESVEETNTTGKQDASINEAGNAVEEIPAFNASDVPEPPANPNGGTIELPDAEQKTERRGRKGLTDAELAALPESRRKKILADRARKSKGRGETPQTKAADIVAAPNMLAKAGAETVAGSLDTLRVIISNNEVAPNDDMRKQVLAVWEQYFEETGKQPPIWVMLTITSSLYVAPAFSTPTGKSRFSKIAGNVRAWFARRFGGK